MTRINQATEKTRRAVDDLDTYCRQLERLARRVSRILVGDADLDGREFLVPLGAALARLDDVVAKVRDAAPDLPAGIENPHAKIAQLMSLEETGDEDRGSGFADVLTELGVNPDDDVEPRSEQQPGECVLRGTSPSLTVPTVLEFLAAHRKTGTLHVRTSSESFAIELAGGQIVHAVSDCTPLEERLGSVLLRRGTIGAEQLQGALNNREGGMLGAILLRENLVARDELIEALKDQASLLFRRLFAHHETQFHFLEGASSGKDLQIDANVTMLLLEGARSNDESQIEPNNEWSDWLK
jgi:Domain of unknown function (DUF4388)